MQRPHFGGRHVARRRGPPRAARITRLSAPRGTRWRSAGGSSTTRRRRRARAARKRLATQRGSRSRRTFTSEADEHTNVGCPQTGTSSRDLNRALTGSPRAELSSCRTQTLVVDARSASWIRDRFSPGPTQATAASAQCARPLGSSGEMSPARGGRRGSCAPPPVGQHGREVGERRHLDHSPALMPSKWSESGSTRYGHHQRVRQCRRSSSLSARGDALHRAEFLIATMLALRTRACAGWAEASPPPTHHGRPRTARRLRGPSPAKSRGVAKGAPRA